MTEIRQDIQSLEDLDFAITCVGPTGKDDCDNPAVVLCVTINPCCTTKAPFCVEHFEYALKFMQSLKRY